jgi:hypothetical protein
LVKTLICTWCNESFTYEAKRGPERKYCSEEHRELARQKMNREWYKTHQKKKSEEPQLILIIEQRSLQEVRTTGLTFEERKLLKERRSAIQIPKERMAERIERAL